ncbi:MMPL family transporter [Gordonia pseudamarae]|uniref:MMPL family transporter n=1 Tax=Gordonia TaxID=2053 RepID=UPI00198BCDAF|nr:MULTISPECIES: MMPL family transporter [Gordonia]MBD0021986.1 MMPL family transporter [Gordonia sp. (in: high G+C Gram-positive bacteria)]QHN24852.1 MMPL family transporter [Gordonia pseudamarae]
MFGAIGTMVFRLRYAVIAVLVLLMSGLGLFGLDLGKHLSQSGWFDPTSESVKGSQIADTAFGRDHKSDVILLITPPEGTKVDDEEFGRKVENFINTLVDENPDVVGREDPGIFDPFQPAGDNAASRAALDMKREQLFSPDRTQAFVSIGIRGDNDTVILENYKKIEDQFTGIAERFDLPGTTFQTAGLQPIAGAMARGMDEDIHRAELIALPLVALMLFFVFGGVVAAVLPVFIGGLTIAGSLGIMKILALTTELNIFAQSVVTLIGLGIAIDYGLFIVSRFREELAEGYSTQAAVRRTVMTAGQTVVFSATIIVAALACLLIMPQGFLKSVAYGAIASVALAAILSITVLPATLAILGPRVDALGLPFLRRTKTKAEIENGFWGQLAGWVMRHPIATAVPVMLFLLVLIVPFAGIKFGGISEAYLPPGNESRQAQEAFDEAFPSQRTEGIKLVIAYDTNDSEVTEKLQSIADQANAIPGFTKQFDAEGDQQGQYGENGPAIIEMSAGLVDRNTAAEAIKDLRAIDTNGLQMWVAGTPALTQDSMDALMSRLPLMTTLLVLITGLLMFLAFGSLILPIKAALMTALGLGATLGILTWIFVDGHGAGIADFTPGPMFAAVLVLIIAIIFGLSTDYEIFLLSRMVEARQKGASTTEAVRVGTAHTGGIITAAAAILVVVTGAFGLSEIVMMKYIAFGMIAALILDATVIRMLLVPATMKLLGDDCWWAPRWMQTMQRKIGLGETILDDEPDQLRDGDTGARVARSAGSVVAEAPTSVLRAARAAGVARPMASQVRRSNHPLTGPPPPRPDSAAPKRPLWAPGSPAPEPAVGGETPAVTSVPDDAVRPPVPAASKATASGASSRSAEPATESAGRDTALPTVRFAPTPQPIGGGGWKTFRTPRLTRSGRDARAHTLDTGSWTLGSSGIRSGSFPAQPATEAVRAIGEPARPNSDTSPPEPPGGPASVDIPQRITDTRTAQPTPAEPTPEQSGPEQSGSDRPSGARRRHDGPDQRPPAARPNGRRPSRRRPSGPPAGPGPIAQAPAPLPPTAPAGPPPTRTPPTTPAPPRRDPQADPSVLARRPDLGGRGTDGPLSASLQPERARRPRLSASSRPDGESLLERGLSPENREHDASDQPADNPVAGNQETGSRSADRHANRDDDKQIRVQDLLRRSQSEQ